MPLLCKFFLGFHKLSAVICDFVIHVVFFGNIGDDDVEEVLVVVGQPEEVKTFVVKVIAGSPTSSSSKPWVLNAFRIFSFIVFSFEWVSI